MVGSSDRCAMREVGFWTAFSLPHSSISLTSGTPTSNYSQLHDLADIFISPNSSPSPMTNVTFQ